MTATIDLTDEQIKYLRTLIAIDVCDRTMQMRSHAFSAYGPTEVERLHEDIRIGSTVLGVLPPRSPLESKQIPHCRPQV